MTKIKNLTPLGVYPYMTILSMNDCFILRSYISKSCLTKVLRRINKQSTVTYLGSLSLYLLTKDRFEHTSAIFQSNDYCLIFYTVYAYNPSLIEIISERIVWWIYQPICVI